MGVTAHLKRSLLFLCISLLLTGILLPPALAAEVVHPAARSLREFLDADGALDMPAGFRGSLDARGWQLVSGPHEAPRFAPIARSPLAADDHWDGRFSNLRGVNGGDVWAVAVDGNGNLYVGGAFTTAGGAPANHIARWSWAGWSALGDGMDGDVWALAVDGSGNVYAGGPFTSAGGVPANYIARWDGSAWSALGSGMDEAVGALAVDGSGNLYAGGAFATAGGVPVYGIARWDGSAWSALGSGMDEYVSALAVDGSGNLYAGGDFSTAGGVPVNYVARWDGSAWSALGSGVNNQVCALAVDGGGNVYAGGYFTEAGGDEANHIARWDGSAWSALGTGVDDVVWALAADSSGNVYAGGPFTSAGGVPGTGYIARWDGSAWSALGSGVNLFVRALAVDGSGALYAGGNFSTAGGVEVNRIARWDGSAWSALGSGMDGAILALAVDGSGNLYAAGAFNTAGGVQASCIARWDGSSWSALGSGMNDYVLALAVDDSGNLYAGGFFTSAGGVPGTGYIARWDGSAWSALGTGMNSIVLALAVDGSGNLYAGGIFTAAGGTLASRIARWDGLQWSALGSGMDNDVRSLAVDGSGNLYAGGYFTSAGGVPAAQIARWNGSSWSALGSGMDGSVQALAMDGSGNVYAGGDFTLAGGVPGTGHVARWDGSAWSALDSGMDSSVWALVVDGSGNLYAGGQFTSAGGTGANYVARWDGSQWSALGSGVNNTVQALVMDDSGDLYAGGWFITAGNKPSSYIARWFNLAPSAHPDGYSMLEDAVLSVPAPGVLGNDSDAQGDPFTLTAYALPPVGTLALDVDGSFQYTPTLNYFGQVAFTYRLADGYGGVSTGTVSITVTNVNDAPVAAADSYTTSEDTPLVVPAPGVLANDSDVDGDSLTAALQAPPLHGTVELHPDGSLAYTPTAGFAGVDTLTYLVSDGELTDTAPVVVGVGAVNNPPVAQDDIYATAEDTPLVVAAPGVLANDLDPEGAPLAALLVNPPGHGTVELDPDGAFTYTPTAGFAGADTWTYLASDGELTDTALVVIDVGAANDPPIAQDDAYATAEDTPLLVAAPGVLANDLDPEGAPLTAALLNAPAHGMVVLEASGAFTYTPELNWSGVVSFTYLVSDGELTATAEGQLVVESVNDAPVAVGDAYTATAGAALVVAAPGVLGNDGDVEDDPLTAVLDTPPTAGTLALDAGGSFVYTPTVGFTGVVTFTYHANDGQAGSAPVVVTIAVLAEPVDSWTVFLPVVFRRAGQ